MIEDMKSICRMTVSPRMRRLVPQLFWTGISIAYYSSCLVPMITDTIAEDKLKRSIVAMVVFGFGEVIGGLIIGQVIDRRGSRYVAVVNVLIVLIMTFVTLAFLGINQFNLLAFLMTFMWGLQDSTVNTHCFEMLGFEFDNNSEPYSIFNLAQALGVFIF
jgi:predicted MFS family arabinose efflux permease